MNTDDRLNSKMLWNGAETYLEAARILFEHERKVSRTYMRTSSHPAYFLACQAIELALKAYLRGSGKTEDFLAKKCNHNLITALQAANEHGLTNLLKLEPREFSALELANKHYSAKVLQFALEGYYEYPPMEILLRIAEELIAKTEAFCLKNVELHNGKSSAVFGLRSARRK